MGTKDLLKKFKEHEKYCDKNYLSLAAESNKQSVMHFAWWLEKVWLPKDDGEH